MTMLIDALVLGLTVTISIIASWCIITAITMSMRYQRWNKKKAKEMLNLYFDNEEENNKKEEA